MISVARLAFLLAILPLLRIFAFVSFLQPGKHMQRRLFTNVNGFLKATKNVAASLANNATSSASKTNADATNENLPYRQQVLRIQSRLEEIHERNARGENLTRKSYLCYIIPTNFCDGLRADYNNFLLLQCRGIL